MHSFYLSNRNHSPAIQIVHLHTSPLRSLLQLRMYNCTLLSVGRPLIGLNSSHKIIVHNRQQIRFTMQQNATPWKNTHENHILLFIYLLIQRMQRNDNNTQNETFEILCVFPVEGLSSHLPLPNINWINHARVQLDERITLKNGILLRQRQASGDF